MAESMKDFEQELEASFKKIEEGDIITGTVVSVDETGVVLDLKYYAEGFIPAEEFSREPGFNIKEAVQPGEEIQATVLRKDDGQGNILLSRAEAADHYGVTLSEDDKNSLVNIISKFRGIDISDDQIKGYVSDAYSTLKDMGVTKSDVKNIFEKAIEFIKGMLSRQ